MSVDVGMAPGPPPGESAPGEPDRYDIEDGARTLEKAHHIKQHPKLHAAVKKHLKRKLSAMRDIVGRK